MELEQMSSHSLNSRDQLNHQCNKDQLSLRQDQFSSLFSSRFSNLCSNISRFLCSKPDQLLQSWLLRLLSHLQWLHLQHPWLHQHQLLHQAKPSMTTMET